jgi:alpha-galactosidase
MMMSPALWKHRAAISISRYRLSALATALLVWFACAQFSGQSRMLARTSPMGWNSWDAYGTTIKESEVKANADAMASKLRQYGWQYIVVDIQWYEPNAKSHGYTTGAVLTMDRYGRLIPASNRFPSATGERGFSDLAAYVHSKGLKFGIHILRGIPRQAVDQNLPVQGSQYRAADIADRASVCKWNGDMYGIDMSKPGAQEYYDSIVSMYARWGVDFIKADDMSRPYYQAEIEALHKAIARTGRPIVLSLSPGPAPLAKIEDLRENAEMWRIEDDLWDDWKSLKNMYSRIEVWSPLVAAGHWPDADMLPLGHIGLRAERGNDRLSALSREEQRTMVAMWSIFRSPLMFGGDLITLDPFTEGLLTNRAVLDIDQHSTENHLAYSKGDLRAWTARSELATESNTTYLALFNVGENPIRTRITWAELAVSRGPGKELWSGAELSQTDAGISVDLPPHASLLYSLSTSPTAR